MRRIAIALIGFELLALCACGYTLAEDQELMDALYWVRDLKADHPEEARAFGQSCKKELTVSGYSRAVGLRLFTGISRQPEAQGHASARGALFERFRRERRDALGH